jgi:hypothetical protein
VKDGSYAHFSLQIENPPRKVLSTLILFNLTKVSQMAGKRGRVSFKETEVSRLLRAAKRADVSVRLDIGADGSFSLVPMEIPTQVDAVATKVAPSLLPWD